MEPKPNLCRSKAIFQCHPKFEFERGAAAAAVKLWSFDKRKELLKLIRRSISSTTATSSLLAGGYGSKVAAPFRPLRAIICRNPIDILSSFM